MRWVGLVVVCGFAGAIAPAIACAQTAYFDPSALTARLNQSPADASAPYLPVIEDAPTPYVAATVTYSQPVPEAESITAAPAPRYASVRDLLAERERDEAVARLNRVSAYVAATEIGVLAPTESRYLRADRDLSMWAATEREVWFDNAGDRVDRVRLSARGPLRRESGSPLPPGPLERAAIPFDEVDVSFTRGWTTTLASGGGLDVTLTPHAGVQLGSSGTSALAGATVQIGPDLDRMVPEGRSAFGDRARWYLYAAGQGRAVGYNFARTRDGDYAGSGYSRDQGVYLGDASVGLAWRKGDMHSAIGLVYRELEPGALVHPGRLGEDVNEGLLAFSLSIKPGS